MTEREKEIVQLHVSLQDYTLVAEQLGVSPKRVRNIVGMYRHQASMVTRAAEGITDVVPRYDPSRILVLGDLHFPYHHPKAFEFIEHLMDTYKPTMVINMGDELDSHSMSFHPTDPDLSGAGDELLAAQAYVSKLHDLIPQMLLLHSNHGSMVYRRALDSGISREYVRSYRDVLDTPDWHWFLELIIELPNKQKVYFHHGKSANVVKLSQSMGMCAVQGHYHEQAGIQYWSNPLELLWGMQVGCLIDRRSLAYAYNNVNLKRPIISAGLIIDSVPQLVPLRT
jgi:hypothetical protein